MWKNIDFDEAFRRISLMAFAIVVPLVKLVEIADDNLPMPVVIAVLVAPLALAWYLPIWALAIPVAVLLASVAWIVVAAAAVTWESERLRRSYRR